MRISAGAFGEGLPKRDLYLSPRHCVASDDVIIPVEVLINGTSIVQMDWSSVEYFRLELEQHDLVWAEGLPAESYMYGGLRSDLHADFESEDGPTTLHPLFASYAPEEDTCLPLVIAGPAVDEVKAHLARQARASSVRALGAKLAHGLVRGTRAK